MPVKVLQIISGFAVEGPLGGIERFGIELSAHLDRKRVENTLVGLWSYGQSYEQAWMDKVQAVGSNVWMGPEYDFSHPYRSFLECYRDFNTNFLGQHFDVIHSHCQFGDVLALLTARRFEARAIMRTIHNEREWGRRPLRRMLLTGFLYPLLCDVEVGVSQRVVDNLDARPMAKLLKHKSKRIYNAVNLERFDKPERIKDIRSIYGIPASAYLIGSVGRLEEQKGYQHLIRAAELVINQYPDAYFMIVGDGGLRDELERQVCQSGLEGRVIITGALSGIEHVLWNWDLFVSSSLWEGLPTVLLESMAAGVPVIATKVSGTQELIQPEENGLLVASGDPEALANAIMRMRSDPGLDQVLVRAASEAVLRFSIESISSEYEKQYEILSKSA